METQDGLITIGGDLSLRFERAESLFDNGSWKLKPEFKKTLNDILPKYLDVLLTDSLKYKIKEIRIEGHTNNMPYPTLDPDPYMANLILSQRRARSIMYFLRNMPQYKQYSDEDKRLLEFWFTANGFSYGHALDNENDFALISNKPINQEESRRVELRIITAGEEILEHFIENNR